MEKYNITINRELRNRDCGPRISPFRIWYFGRWSHSYPEHERNLRWENNPLLDAGIQISQSTTVCVRFERDLQVAEPCGIIPVPTSNNSDVVGGWLLEEHASPTGFSSKINLLLVGFKERQVRQVYAVRQPTFMDLIAFAK